MRNGAKCICCSIRSPIERAHQRIVAFLGEKVSKEICLDLWTFVSAKRNGSHSDLNPLESRASARNILRLKLVTWLTVNYATIICNSQLFVSFRFRLEFSRLFPVGIFNLEPARSLLVVGVNKIDVARVFASTGAVLIT